MTEAKKDEPLEGLNIIDYDEDKEVVTIEIHRLLLKHSADKVAEKCVEIITAGPSVAGVNIVRRKN